MEAVRSRPGLHGNNHSRVAAVLGEKTALLHLELRNGVDAGLGVLGLIVPDIQIRRTVQVEVVLRATPSQGMESAHIVEVRVEIVLGAAGHARNGAHQGDPVAAVHGQFGDLLGVHQVGFLHGGGLNSRRFAGDVNDFADLPDLQHYLSHIQFCVDVEGDAGLGLLESGQLHRECVSTGLQINGLEAAAFVCGYFTGSSSLCGVHNPDLGAGNHRSRRIHYRAAQRLRLRH